MVASKESFLMFKRRKATFDKLPDELAGQLIKAVFYYEETGERPVDISFVVSILLEDIIIDLQKEEERYKAICERNRNNGKRGGRPQNVPQPPIIEEVEESLPTETEPNPEENEKTQWVSEKPKKANININTNINEVSIKVDTESRPEAEPSALSFDRKQLRLYFNDKMQGKMIPSINDITDKRTKAIKVCISKYGKEAVKKVIDIAAENDFLNGVNSRNWTATFDWLFNINNFSKVLDGNYNNAQRPQQQPGNVSAPPQPKTGAGKSIVNLISYLSETTDYGTDNGTTTENIEYTESN